MPVPDPEPFRLLKQYPLLCGLFIFVLEARFQEIGLAFANAWGSLLYAGQLYNAARQEKLLLRPWEDMELLIMLQSEGPFIVGNRPKGLEEYLKRFLLSMGYSATAFASNRRRGAAIASSRGPRALTALCKVGSLFTGRYCNNDRAVSWTSESLTPIIESMMDDDSDDDDDDPSHSKAKPTEKKPKKKIKMSATGSLLKKPRGHRSSEVPTLDFLELLANALQAESLEFTFDYLNLHRICWDLLRRVNEACRPKLLQMYGGGYLEKENQLPFIVGYIFMTATTTSRVANLLLPRRGDTEVSSRLLAMAADCIGGMIESGAGRTEVNMLEARLGYELDLSALDEVP